MSATIPISLLVMARKKADLSQTQLATVLQVAASVVSRLEATEQADVQMAKRAWFKNPRFRVTQTCQSLPKSSGFFAKSGNCRGLLHPRWGQARSGCSCPNPSNVSQCGCSCPVINCLGLLPTRSGTLLRIKVRWFRKNCSKLRYPPPSWRRSVK